MWKTIAVVGATAVIVGGAGTGALAASATTAPTPSASSSSSASGHSAKESAPKAGKHKANRLRSAVHATWVTQNKKTKTFRTHEAIRGQVTSVSATSITVKAADSVTETFVLDSGTKVRSRVTKAAVSVSDVKTGDPVLVAGTGTKTPTASRVIETKK